MSEVPLYLQNQDWNLDRKSNSAVARNVPNVQLQTIENARLEYENARLESEPSIENARLESERTVAFR